MGAASRTGRLLCECSRVHISENDLKKHLVQFPVPNNLVCIPVMDANLKATIRKEGLKTSLEVDLDEDLATIQLKIPDIIGPLEWPGRLASAISMGRFRQLISVI